MVERFVENTGTISVTSGESVVNGIGTTFSGRDRAGSRVIAYPTTPGQAPIAVGTVAEVDPQGIYDNLELPLVTPYRGATLTSVPYELVDGAAIASGATQAAIFARYTAFLEQNMGLVGSTSDDIDYSLVPNNSLFIDAVTRVIYQWRNGLLVPVETVATAFVPRGAYSAGTTYAKNDMVQFGSYVFVSNADANTGHAPDTAPASTAYWMWYPTTAVQPVLDALGIHGFIISTQQPTGGQDGDVWFVVPA